VKKNYGWPEDVKFLVPDGVYDDFKNGVGKRGSDLSSAWGKLFDGYAKQFPDLAANLAKMQARELPAGWDKDIPSFPADAKGMGTRESSGKTLNAIAKNIPWFIGGSADLANPTKRISTHHGQANFYLDNTGAATFTMASANMLWRGDERNVPLRFAPVRWNIFQF